jgi:hypothetical protein
MQSKPGDTGPVCASKSWTARVLEDFTKPLIPFASLVSPATSTGTEEVFLREASTNRINKFLFQECFLCRVIVVETSDRFGLGASFSEERHEG